MPIVVSFDNPDFLLRLGLAVTLPVILALKTAASLGRFLCSSFEALSGRHLPSMGDAIPQITDVIRRRSRPRRSRRALLSQM